MQRRSKYPKHLRFKRDTVVYAIHGFGGKRLWMQPLARRLKRML